MTAVLERVVRNEADALPRIDYSQLIEHHLGLPDRVRGDWRDLVDETVRTGRAEELHAARGEYQAIVRGRADQLAGFLAFGERVAEGSGRESPTVSELRRKWDELAAFHDTLFARWQSLDDLRDILVEQFRLPADAIRAYIAANPIPQAWHDEEMNLDELFADAWNQPCDQPVIRSARVNHDAPVGRAESSRPDG